MRFIDLHIDGFGRFHDFSMTFDPGMNVIYGTNEAGKSTLHTFLQAMLYGFTRARGVEAEHDTMARLTPWENPVGTCGGSPSLPPGSGRNHLAHRAGFSQVQGQLYSGQ